MLERGMSNGLKDDDLVVRRFSGINIGDNGHREAQRYSWLRLAQPKRVGA